MRVTEEQHIDDQIDAFVSSVPDVERPVLEELVVLPNAQEIGPEVIDLCFKFRSNIKAFLATKMRALSEETGLPQDALQELILERILH